MNPTKMFKDAKTAEQLRTAFVEYFLKYCADDTMSRSVLALNSGGRQYRFYWFAGKPSGRGGRLGVKVVKLPRNPIVEELAATVRATRTCANDHCREAFPTNGRRRYCKPACASIARQRRWQTKHGKLPKHVLAARADEETRRAEKRAYWADRRQAATSAADRDARRQQRELWNGTSLSPRPPMS